MIRIVDIKPLSGHKLHIKYSNGVEGDLDLSFLVGKGVFKNFEDENYFNKVRISDTGAPTWDGDVDVDVINSYLKITGKTFEEFKKEENC